MASNSLYSLKNCHKQFGQAFLGGASLSSTKAYPLRKHVLVLRELLSELTITRMYWIFPVFRDKELIRRGPKMVFISLHVKESRGILVVISQIASFAMQSLHLVGNNKLASLEATLVCNFDLPSN